MNAILDFAQAKSISLANEIVSGKIEMNPVLTKEFDACTYCDYKDACGYDGKIKGYEKRRITEVTLEAFCEETGLKNIQKTTGDAGGEEVSKWE